MLRMLVSIAIAFSASRAEAQIVNIAGQLAKVPDKNGVTPQFEGKLDWRTGNNPLFQIGGTGSLLLHEGKFVGLVVMKGEYGESRDTTLSRKTFEHVRARYSIDCRWKWEAFAQHEFDRFRRLTVRAIAGTGPALQILKEKSIAVLTGASYLFEIEQLDKRPGTIDAGDRTVFHRASFYASAVESPGPHIEIVETFYAQPRIDDPGDFRLLGELSITSKVSKHVALTNGFTVAYDRTPPDGIVRVDTQLTVGAIVKF